MDKGNLLNDTAMVGVSDIARLAGVTKATVINWRAKFDDFPSPAENLTSGPIYSREAIGEWLEKRQPNRPKIQPLGIEAQLWKAADALRNNMDAAEYKHVVLGLIFLKYISDSFEEHRNHLYRLTQDSTSEYFADARDGELVLEDRDEYLAKNVFWVPIEARWKTLVDNAKQPTIGKTIDDAMVAIEKDNPSLKGVLPKDYARPTLDWHRLGELVDLISNIGVGGKDARDHDVLGRVYEYFLSQFASAEGKKGGQFYTPRSVVRLLVEMLEPYTGRVYDPCCGSGGMFVQSVKFVEAHGGKRNDVAVYGQESNPTTWRLAAMNLAIRGIEANLGPENADSFRRDLHPDLKADFVIANPPFNDSHWNGELLREDVRWKYGVPPAGNANFAWVQHFAHHLSPRGYAGFVLANGSLSSQQSGEGDIRKRMVDADLVDCVIALPGQLFYSTPIPVSLWFLARDKSGGDSRRDRRGEILFVDAREVGHLVDRTHRDLADGDVARITETYHSWRGDAGAGAYMNIPGFCASADRQLVANQDFTLTPGRYVDHLSAMSPEVDLPARVSELRLELEGHFTEASRLQEAIRRQLERISV